MKANDTEMFDVVFRYLQMSGRTVKFYYREKVYIKYVKSIKWMKYITVVDQGIVTSYPSRTIDIGLGKDFHISFHKNYDTGEVSCGYFGFRGLEEIMYVRYLADFIMEELYNEAKDKIFTRTIKT